MNVAGIFLLSILGAILFVVLIAGIAAMIVLHFRTQRMFGELKESLTAFSTDLKGMVEKTQTSFTGIRADIKTAQEKQGKELSKTLKEHEAAFRDTIGKIDGETLVRASVQALHTMRELAALAQTFKNLLADHEAPAAMNLAAEEYGPSDTIYEMPSRTSQLDEVALREEAREMEPLFADRGEGL